LLQARDDHHAEGRIDPAEPVRSENESIEEVVRKEGGPALGDGR
jgi:hypothetical protein